MRTREIITNIVQRKMKSAAATGIKGFITAKRIGKAAKGIVENSYKWKVRGK